MVNDGWLGLEVLLEVHCNFQEVNHQKELETEDDGANILSIVTTSDEAFAAYQMVQKDGYFIGETDNRFAEWDCSHGMTGVWDLFILFDWTTNN